MTLAARLKAASLDDLRELIPLVVAELERNEFNARYSNVQYGYIDFAALRDVPPNEAYPVLMEHLKKEIDCATRYRITINGCSEVKMGQDRLKGAWFKRSEILAIFDAGMPPTQGEKQ